jgi:hypothetical protein
MVAESPDTIDLSSGGGPWAAFVLSGVTGVTALNTSYALLPFDGEEYHYVAASGHRVRGGSPGGEWIIDNGALTEYFVQECLWPWEASSWNASGGAGGTLVFTRAPGIPDALDLSGDGATAAMLTTALTGANNDLIFESLLPGRLGNSIRVRYVNPGTNNAALSVTVSGRDITVNLATNGSGQITSTATQVKDALDVDEEASVLVIMAAAGLLTGVVTAMGWTNLSGGTGGVPLPPGTLTL